MSRHLSKEASETANKNIKRYSTSSITREIKKHNAVLTNTQKKG